MTGTASARLFAALTLALALSACSVTSKVAPADAFANAGIAYADAVPSVYDESFVLAVTADSLVLDQTRGDLPPEVRANTLSLHDRPLEKRLKLLRRLKRHALALRAYFIAFKSITQSDAAAGITEATQGLLSRTCPSLTNRQRPANGKRRLGNPTENPPKKHPPMPERNPRLDPRNHPE